jgi:hypothetical protein
MVIVYRFHSFCNFYSFKCQKQHKHVLSHYGLFQSQASDETSRFNFLLQTLGFIFITQKSIWRAGVTSTGVKNFEKGDTLLIAGAKYAR